VASQSQTKHVSNGLSGEVKLRIFQEVVEEDNEFAHDCGERESLGLTGSQESLVKFIKDRIVTGGYKCGHCLRPAPQTRSPRLLEGCPHTSADHDLQRRPHLAAAHPLAADQRFVALVTTK
jgi:hypothetical protein